MCGKIRGDFLNLTGLLCGNRFGRGLVRPGGCKHDLEPERAVQLLEKLRGALAEVNQAAGWLWDSNSVRARFELTGKISAGQAAEIGLVGVAARASGLVRDVRFDHPAGWHRFAPVPVAVWPDGDVLARARVRWLEIQRSGKFLDEQLLAPPDGEILCHTGSHARPTAGRGARRRLARRSCHVALTDSFGKFRRYKIVDASFHNWIGLELAMRGQAISDFPICNKSFNLSYCGFDL